MQLFFSQLVENEQSLLVLNPWFKEILGKAYEYLGKEMSRAHNPDEKEQVNKG